MVLAGSINKQIVGYINEAGGKAVGLGGKDYKMAKAPEGEPHRGGSGLQIEEIVDLGFVGEPETVDTTVLNPKTPAAN